MARFSFRRRNAPAQAAPTPSAVAHSASLALLIVVAVVLGGLGAVVAGATSTRTAVLLGRPVVAKSVHWEAAGHASAFAYRASSSGTVTAVTLYVHSRGSRAARLGVAIYTDAHGHPGSLVTRGVRNDPPARAWDRIAVRATRLSAGRRYWLAVLPSRGRIALRYEATRACRREIGRRAKLTRFPSRWRGAAGSSSACQLSAFASGRASRSVSKPPASSPGGTQPTTGTTPTTPGSPTPKPQGTSCFATPSSCGYPDQSNTGVPAGTALTTKNGDQQINQPGTYSGWNVVNGSVRINASNVTLKDSAITNSGDTSNDILIPSGVSNVTIEDSTLRGAASNSALQYSVQNASDASSITGLRLDMYYCTECWSGSGTLQDSYAISNGVISGSHYEDIYYGGGGGALVLTHDTLLNPQDQTAAIFTKGDFGNVGTVTVTNNLLAGGGYTIYGGLSGSGSVVGPVTVTGNRFARCLSSCGAGGDSHGYYPHSGSYDYGADFNNSVTTWSGNYWDDNLQNVPRP